jgi:hypothetical protein
MNEKQKEVFSDDLDLSQSKLEIYLEDKWVSVDERLWRAYTGFRRIDGTEYHGPIYGYDTRAIWTKIRRDCPCNKCQSLIAGEFRLN